MSNLTLEDIAKKAGVSRSTVSRVVNDQPNVKEDVRAKVQEVIAETGYRPHAAARSLASRRTQVIGLVIPSMVHTLFTDPYFPRLTEGIALACNETNYTLSLYLFTSKQDEDELFPRLTSRGLLDGLVIQATNLQDTLFAKYRQGAIPFVIVGKPPEEARVSYIDVDNVAGAYSAVTHLISLGRRRIATITGPLETGAGSDRLEGYQNALIERGLTINKDLIVEGDFTEIGGFNATQKLLPFNFDALFIASDVMGLGALRALREAGKSVPKDVALVGYDDLPPAIMADPQLTTIRQPIKRIGIQAVDILLEIISNGPQPPRRVILGTELVIRESCGQHAQYLQRINP